MGFRNCQFGYFKFLKILRKEKLECRVTFASLVLTNRATILNPINSNIGYCVEGLLISSRCFISWLLVRGLPRNFYQLSSDPSRAFSTHCHSSVSFVAVCSRIASGAVGPSVTSLRFGMTASLPLRSNPPAPLPISPRPDRYRVLVLCGVIGGFPADRPGRSLSFGPLFRHHTAAVPCNGSDRSIANHMRDCGALPCKSREAVRVV